MINVLIVEDQKMSREYMENYIKESGRYAIRASIANAASAKMYCIGKQVDLILMDVCTEHDENGIEETKLIKKSYPEIKIIIVTSMLECSFIARAQEAGADSFWYKDSTAVELIDVMDRTVNGENVYPDKTPDVRIGLIKSCEFTASELKVLRLVVEGMSYEEMAVQLGVSVSAIRYHITNMLQKTGYPNKTRLAIAAANKSFIIPKSDGEFGFK